MKNIPFRHTVPLVSQMEQRARQYLVKTKYLIENYFRSFQDSSSSFSLHGLSKSLRFTFQKCCMFTKLMISFIMEWVYVSNMYSTLFYTYTYVNLQGILFYLFIWFWKHISHMNWYHWSTQVLSQSWRLGFFLFRWVDCAYIKSSPRLVALIILSMYPVSIKLWWFTWLLLIVSLCTLPLLIMLCNVYWQL